MYEEKDLDSAVDTQQMYGIVDSIYKECAVVDKEGQDFFDFTMNIIVKKTAVKTFEHGLARGELLAYINKLVPVDKNSCRTIIMSFLEECLAWWGS